METGKKEFKLSADVKVAGVIAGLAEYFDIDVNLARIAYAVFTVATFFAPGIVAYIILMFAMVKNREAKCA
ncbi:MAG: PspC domain-containing protein [Paludibacteraceae bacterium]|jgi:phage shock protein C|nr:PspC domain-containing protein [Paludibacteraceae bacterium]